MMTPRRICPSRTRCLIFVGAPAQAHFLFCRITPRMAEAGRRRRGQFADRAGEGDPRRSSSIRRKTPSLWCKTSLVYVTYRCREGGAGPYTGAATSGLGNTRGRGCLKYGVRTHQEPSLTLRRHSPRRAIARRYSKNLRRSQVALPREQAQSRARTLGKGHPFAGCAHAATLRRS